MEEMIIKMYFENKMKQVEIAKTLNISKYKVSRVVTRDERYQEEKEKRKHQNKQEHTDKTKKYIYDKREKEFAINQQLKQNHIQASIELSGKKSINNRAFRKWNSSIYKLNPKKKYYEIDKNITVSNDVPKIVK